ncbi:MAG: MFS transporter, partial [Pseudomonadota bacterium]
AVGISQSVITMSIALFVVMAGAMLRNVITVSWRQRRIPSDLLGRVNSIYRLLAWGMMPVGLLLSGVIVRTAEQVTSRDIALSAPFVVAAAGAWVLVVMAWRPLSVGFKRADAR